MKILYIIHGLPIGGAETLVVNYLIRLKESGHEVGLVELRRIDTFLRQRLVDNNVPIFSLMTKLGLKEKLVNKFYPRYWISQLNKAVERFSPDVVHFHTRMEDMDRISFPADLTFMTFHARLDRLVNKKNFSIDTLSRLATRGMTFVAISSTVHEDICRMIPEAKTVMIPNGVDLSAVRAANYNRKELCKNLGIHEESFLLGQVGRFNKIKNHKFTISLLPELIKREPKCQLLLVGTGSADEQNNIRKQATALNVEGHIKYLGQRDDATSLMSVFDALILPSFSESFSLVLIEAQAKGIRCVASDRVPEEVICNSNSFRLPLEAPQEMWCDYILGHQKEEHQRDIMAFDIGKVIENHIKNYERSINKLRKQKTCYPD